MIRPDDEQEHLRVSFCIANGDATAHVISTHSASRLVRIRLRCQAWTPTVSCLNNLSSTNVPSA